MRSDLVIFTQGDYIGIYHILHETKDQLKYFLDGCYNDFLKSYELSPTPEDTFNIITNHVAIQQFVLNKVKKHNRDMSKLIDKLRYRFFDKRRDGYLDGSPGVGNRKWMFARCSGIHDGFVPAISLPAVVEDECYLSGVNPQRIPLWWIERKFIKGYNG